jgi:prevent-host-death family protein
MGTGNLASTVYSGFLDNCSIGGHSNHMTESRKAVGARELKTRLGTYLRQVQKGATIVVTERGRPVAELRPLSVSGGGEEARLRELVELGVLTRPNDGSLKPFNVIKATVSLSSAVIEDREDRF